MCSEESLVQDSTFANLWAILPLKYQKPIFTLHSELFCWEFGFVLNKWKRDHCLNHCLRCIHDSWIFACSEQTAARPTLNFLCDKVQKGVIFASFCLRTNTSEEAGNECFLQFYMLLTLGWDHQEEIIPLLCQLHCQWFKRQRFDVGGFCLNLCPVKALFVASFYCAAWIHLEQLCLSL